KSGRITHSLFKSTRFYLHHPMATCESCCLDNMEPSEHSPGVRRAPPSSSAGLKNPHHPHVFSVPRRSGRVKEFFPLTAEADYSRNEDLDVSMSFGNEASRMELRQRGRREAEQEAAGNYHLPRSQTHLNENMEKDLPSRQRAHSSGSLDELWIKFLERQKRHQHRDFGSNGELTLVERLD
ncbi:hypothetical protein N310_12553, partial [Acanthisitta chloris]